MTLDSHKPQQVVFEHPLNERMRTFLRLEQLFDQISSFWQDDSALGFRMIIDKLQAVFDTLSRFDIRGESLKELERFSESLGQYRNFEGIDQNLIDTLLAEIESLVSALHDKVGSIGDATLKHEIFSGVAKRSAIAGGPCHFDFPAYHFWLQKPIQHRREVVLAWLNELEPIGAAIRLILRLVRESAVPQDCLAHQGYYQQSFDSKQAYQSLRIYLTTASDCFPEVSASKHQVHIRFFSLGEQDNLILMKDDIEFSLACCTI